MSMNFAREQSLLRQRLQAAGSPTAGAARQQELGTTTTCLGAPAAAIEAAAADLVAQFPQMGRAQMTAFVRTLWQSRIHELRAVGTSVLAARAALLEPADLPLLENLLRDTDAEPLLVQFADRVVGALLARHRKLWKELRRMMQAGGEPQRRALVRACRLPVLAEPETFARCAEVLEPLLGVADPLLQTAVDELLAAVAARAPGEARAFAERHGRLHVAWPAEPTPAPAATPAAPPPSPPEAEPEVDAAEASQADPVLTPARPAGAARPRSTAPARRTATRTEPAKREATPPRQAAKRPARKPAAARTPAKKVGKGGKAAKPATRAPKATPKPAAKSKKR